MVQYDPEKNGFLQGQSEAERLSAWLDDTQVSNRLGAPIYANPSELKADIRALQAQVEQGTIKLHAAEAIAQTRTEQAHQETQRALAAEKREAALREALERAEERLVSIYELAGASALSEQSESDDA